MTAAGDGAAAPAVHGREVALRLLRGEPGEMAELQRVLESAPAYTQRITGLPPVATEAQSMYSILPPGKSYDDKFVFGVDRCGRMVGCADVVRGYPDSQTAYVGLLLVAEPFQRQGVGRAAYRALESVIRSWQTCTRVRLAVVATNDAVLPFWAKLGFVPTG
jgi:GNAT superfamily N-acetyltransferase